MVEAARQTIAVIRRSFIRARLSIVFCWLLYALRDDSEPERNAGKSAQTPPRYPLVSATLIGRLAVDHRHQGHGIDAVARPCVRRVRLGDKRFKRQIAKALGRRVAPRPQGRPRKPAKDNLLPQVTWGSAEIASSAARSIMFSARRSRLSH